MIHKIIYLILLFCYSCGATSASDFRKQGERVSRELLIELEEVYTQKQLLERSSAIQKKIEQLVDLILEARRSHCEPSQLVGMQNASMQLQRRLQELYAIDGCQEVIEDLQRESLRRLDALQVIK